MPISCPACPTPDACDPDCADRTTVANLRAELGLRPGEEPNTERAQLAALGCDWTVSRPRAIEYPDAPTDEPAPVPGDEGIRFDRSRGFGGIELGPTFDLVGVPGSLEGRWALNVARLGDEDDGDPGVGALPGARRE